MSRPGGISSCYINTIVLLGVEIGSLPNLLHDVSGTLEFISTTRIRIRNFHYDGQGPGITITIEPPMKATLKKGQFL